MDFVQQLAATEQLRLSLAEKLGTSSEQSIDLIELPTARLAMRAVAAEEGIPLKGGDSLIWHRFLRRTCRELEEFYWDKNMPRVLELVKNQKYRFVTEFLLEPIDAGSGG